MQHICARNVRQIARSAPGGLGRSTRSAAPRGAAPTAGGGISEKSYGAAGYWADSTGMVDAPSERALHRAAYDAVGILAEEGPVHVMGHSLGTAVAVHVAAVRAHDVASLTLFSPLRSLMSMLPATLLNIWKPVCDSFRSESDARSIHMPALVIHGEADEVIPVAHGIRMAHLLHTKPVLLKDVGHNDILENADALKAVADFLDGVEPKATHLSL